LRASRSERDVVASAHLQLSDPPGGVVALYTWEQLGSTEPRPTPEPSPARRPTTRLGVASAALRRFRAPSRPPSRLPMSTHRRHTNSSSGRKQPWLRCPIHTRSSTARQTCSRRGRHAHADTCGWGNLAGPGGSHVTRRSPCASRYAYSTTSAETHGCQPGGGADSDVARNYSPEPPDDKHATHPLPASRVTDPCAPPG
jgi:hypothetical protein